MQNVNFDMIHKGLKPSRSARQLQDTLSQDFLISSDQTSTLKLVSTANQSNKFAMRPSGDSDQCDTHHSEEMMTQLDECGAKPSHYLNIQPVADIRQHTKENERRTDQFIANNNSRKNSFIGSHDDENYVKQKVLINNKDLNIFEKLNNNVIGYNQTFMEQQIESGRITPNQLQYEPQQITETLFQKKDNSNTIQNNGINVNNNNYVNLSKDNSNYNDWMKEYNAANIPIPLQRVSSPQRHLLYKDQKYFATSQQQQIHSIKQQDDCESLKPEDLLMSQQEYNRFQEVQKHINFQINTKNGTNESNQDVIINHLQSFQGGPILFNSQEYQNQQQINQNGINPITLSKESKQQQQIQPQHFNFNSTYSFSNNQFKNYIIPICQQQQHDTVESGFNPEQQLNSISSSCILNIQSPKSNTVPIQPIPTPQILQIDQETEEVKLHMQKLKENVLKQKVIENKENKNNNSMNITSNNSQTNQNNTSLNKNNISQQNKNNKFLKRNQSASHLNPISMNKNSIHEGNDRLQTNQKNISKELKRSITPQSSSKRLERKMSDNLLLDKSKKKREAYQDQSFKECTFKPKINKQSQQMQRSFSQLLETQSIQNKSKQERQRLDLIKYAEDNQIKEKPDISRASQRIVEQKRQTESQNIFGIPQQQEKGVHNRLYSFHKKNDSNLSLNRKRIEEETNKENTFKPQIHSRSKSIKRDEKIEDLLFKDAVRRNNLQQNFLQQKPHSNSKYVSEKSEKILLKKFIKEMDFIFNSLTINQGKNTANNSQLSGPTYLDMASLFEVMIKSGFVKYNQTNQPDSLVLENEKKLIFLMWTLLGGKQFNTITKENLFFFFIIILNLDKSFDNEERSMMFKELSYSISNNSTSQTPSPMASQTSLKNFKNFEIFASLLSSNLNTQTQAQSQTISPLNKSSASSSFHSPSSTSNVHHQLNSSLMKGYNENFINISLGKFDEKQQWIVNDDDKVVIRQAFELFYRNRLSYEELKSQKSPSDQSCTFHPNILQSSKLIANQYREKLLAQTAALIDNKDISYSVPRDGKIQHSDFLILQKRAQEVQHKNKQEIEKQKQLIECSFKPQIQGKGKCDSDKSMSNINGIKKSEELYQQSKNKENKPMKNINEAEFEKQKNECTFQPDLLENRFKKSYEGGIFAKNVNKTIERMRNARKERELVNLMKQRGYNSQNQINRQQKSISSASTVQIDQICDNYSSNNTRKDDTIKNYSSISQVYSNGGERTLSYNSFQIANDNQGIYSNNNSVMFKNANYVELQPLSQDNQFLSGQMDQQAQFNNLQSKQQQQQSSSQQSSHQQSSSSIVPQSNLLNGNIFANQAIQQFSQRNQQNLQHSFAQYSNGYNSVQSQQNNYNSIQNISNNISNAQYNYEQNQMNNPLLEQSAPIFGNHQENQIQNSWVQNNINNENQQNETSQPNITEKAQESINSVPDTKDCTPLLFVDVSLGNQRNERIIINEGDNPQQLAYEFAQLHGLDEQTAEKLYQLLENQIAGLLSRIEEEENISHLENLD